MDHKTRGRHSQKSQKIEPKNKARKGWSKGLVCEEGLAAKSEAVARREARKKTRKV